MLDWNILSMSNKIKTLANIKLSVIKCWLSVIMNAVVGFFINIVLMLSLRYAGDHCSRQTPLSFIIYALPRLLGKDSQMISSYHLHVFNYVVVRLNLLPFSNWDSSLRCYLTHSWVGRERDGFMPFTDQNSCDLWWFRAKTQTKAIPRPGCTPLNRWPFWPWPSHSVTIWINIMKELFHVVWLVSSILNGFGWSRYNFLVCLYCS